MQIFTLMVINAKKAEFIHRKSVQYLNCFAQVHGADTTYVPLKI